MSSFRLLFLLAGAAAAGRAGPASYLDGGYHGGALVVTDPARAQGHLAPGQVLPIRLSRLAPPAAPGAAEVAGSVRYGQLECLAVAAGSITFLVALRDRSGALGPARVHTLQLGDSLDLDGDGLPDLALEYPQRPLTVHAAAVDYALLSFRCDQAHTTLFALDPGAFPGGHYPYGISGVTPGGRFIFQSDSLAPAGPALALPVAPAPGDVLVDADTGRFGRIERITRADGRWSFDLAPPRSPFLFTKEFGAAYVHLSGDLADLARRYRPSGPVRAAAWNGHERLDLLDIDRTRTLLDTAWARVDLLLAARLGLSLDLTATISYHGATAALDAQVDEDLRLAVQGRIGQPWSQGFGPWTLAAPSLGFAAGGVPITLALPVTAGVAVAFQGAGEVFEGVRASGGWGWSGALGASWGWHGVRVDSRAPAARSSVVCVALPENRARLEGQGSLRPWLAVTPTLGVAAILTGSCPATLTLAGTCAGDGTGVHARVDAETSLTAGFSLDLPLLGQAWNRSWPVYAWSGMVWSGAWPASRPLTAAGARVP